MKLPFIISVPHCSAKVPEDIRNVMALNRPQVMESVDYGTHEIFGSLPAIEKTTAPWSRLVVDPNRDPGQMDAKGVVALTDYHGRPVYPLGREPDPDAIAQRVRRYHRPYHDKLEKALGNQQVLGLIDGHSLNAIGPADAPDPGQPRKDVILSNNGTLDGDPRPDFGPTSCSVDQIRLFKRCFEAQGFSVSLNSPYQGGYIVKHYGKLLTRNGRFAIQIEMNQNLYMQSDSSNPDALRLQTVGQKVIKALKEITDLLMEGDAS